MPARPIVLDANILIRFVLGEQVPALLIAHAATIDFLAPDTAFGEAREHLPTILRARGDDGTGEVAALDKLDAVTAPSSRLCRPTATSHCVCLRWRASASATNTTGRCWPAPCCSTAPSGPRTGTSSAPALPPGRRPWWSCTSRIQTQDQRNNDPRSMSEARARAELIDPAPKAAASGWRTAAGYGTRCSHPDGLQGRVQRSVSRDPLRARREQLV